MTGKLPAWLVLEGIIGTGNLCYKHVGIFSDNTATLSWTQRGAAKNSVAAGRLLRVLALRKRVARASPLVGAYVSVDLNVHGDIPSFSFGYYKQWHCTNSSKILSLINDKLLIPHQHYWQAFRLSFALSTKVVFELGTKASPMGEWKGHRRIGNSFGGSGVPVANPSELTHTWSKSISKSKQGLKQDLQTACEKAATAVKNRYNLEKFMQHSEVST